MSGIELVLSIARDALSAQQRGMDVTAHNIANVNTPGYSRQSPVYEAKQPVPYGGMWIGRGVDTTQIVRSTDRFIENRLMQQKSSLSSSKEMEHYMEILEDIFNENSETSLSGMLADFWNLWHDIANNPSGAPQRTALYEHSLLLSERFCNLDDSLKQIEADLTNSVSAEVNEINQITAQIAYLNDQIVGMEAGSTANDLRDQRNTLVLELSQSISAKIFEQDNGSLTIVTAKGCTLVSDNQAYEIKLEGINGDRVTWQGSGNTAVDITDYITEGKIGGWLDIRDEVIAKNSLDLDAVAKEFIWAVNQQHSQGVGLEAFSTVTGSYGVSDSGEELGTQDSGLDYFDKISDGTFNLWIYDSNGAVVGGSANVITVDADPGGTTLTSLGNDIDAIAHLSATITADGKLKIDSETGYTFAFSEDTSNVLAALGINTFFAGATAGGVGVTNTIASNKSYVAAAQIGADGTFATGDNSNALAVVDLQYTSQDISQWTCDRVNGNTEGTVTTTIEDYYHAMVGSIGIKSASISRDRDFNEVMAKKLEEIRDGISAVSLDEEMTNLIKFQHAYVAAAKLISVSDELLENLMSIK